MEAKSQMNKNRIWGRKPHGSEQPCVEYEWVQNREIQELCRKGGGSYCRSRIEHESTVSCCCGESKYPAELDKQKIVCQVHEIILPLHSEVSVSQPQEHPRCKIPTVLLENLQDHRLCLDLITFTEWQLRSSNYVPNTNSLPTDNKYIFAL